jgi:hypothetical protein
MVKRLLILPTITKTLAAGTSLPAVADPTGQTVTPSNYVGFPAAGSAAITYLRLGKAGVVQSQEVVLVDLETRLWLVLQRSVNGSPLVAHDASHGIETIVPPDGLRALIGHYVAGTLEANAVEVEYGTGLTLDASNPARPRLSVGEATRTGASGEARVRSPMERLALYDRFG